MIITMSVFTHWADIGQGMFSFLRLSALRVISEQCMCLQNPKGLFS